MLLVHLSAMEKLLEDFIDDTEHLSMVSIICKSNTSILLKCNSLHGLLNSAVTQGDSPYTAYSDQLVCSSMIHLTSFVFSIFSLLFAQCGSRFTHGVLFKNRCAVKQVPKSKFKVKADLLIKFLSLPNNFSFNGPVLFRLYHQKSASALTLNQVYRS